MDDSAHLDDNVASEFVSGTLAAPALSRAESHLATCRDCRALVAALAADSGDDSSVATRGGDHSSPSQVTARPTRALTIGDQVGRYLVLSELGSGGMGVVFAAYDPKLDRKVALKLLRAGVGYNTKEARTRLRREAQAIARLSHPNVVNVYDVGSTDDGHLYIAMEFIEGDTLTRWLKNYPRSVQDIIDVFVQAARGLYAAHSVGLLHRDFKPDNVLVGGDGRVRVMDFGLARSLITPDDAARPAAGATTALNVELTVTGTVLGTPRYMAPEQLTGPDIDARADQFSLCVALYEALYGRHPLPGATSVAMLERGQSALAPPETSRVPPAIARAVQRGLERDRARRFPSMTALIHELAPRPARPRMRASLVALVGLLFVAGGVAAFAGGGEPADPPAAMSVPETAGRHAISVLTAKVEAHEHHIARLHEERRQVAEERRQDRELIARMRSELEVAAAEARRARAQLRRVREAGDRLPQAEAVIGAVDNAEGPIRGCFVEWSERTHTADADMIVRLVVNPNGVPHSATASGPDDYSLRFCVTAALIKKELVRYPAGPEQLEMEVRVLWSAGMLSLQPDIVGRRKVTPGLIDMQ